MLYVGFSTTNYLCQECWSLEAYMEDLSSYTEIQRYAEYLQQNSKLAHQVINIEADSYVHSEGMDVSVLSNYEGELGNSILTNEEGLVEWEVNVKEEGYYNLDVVYSSIEGKSSDIQRGIFIDGKLSFQEANMIGFNCFWDNAKAEIEVDNQGNDLRPS